MKENALMSHNFGCVFHTQDKNELFFELEIMLGMKKLPLNVFKGQKMSHLCKGLKSILGMQQCV